MATKINKKKLTEAEAHRDRLDALRKSMEEIPESEERDDYLATLKYVSSVMSNHYRNLLHCYSYEKNSK